jgi:ATP-dependent DNA helicase PIF1
MELSREQQQAYDKFLSGQNIFITGPGGTGKSALIKQIYGYAKDAGIQISVTALTGCAAILLGCKATTLHSWAGIGLGNMDADFYVEKISKSRHKKANWIRTRVLVVDEISMLSLKLFLLLDEIGQRVRKNKRPFGGIQLVFSGDFFQLPPVGKEEDPDSMKFCFESEELWNHVFLPENQIELKQIFRQSDEVFSSILNQVREGAIKKKTNDLLESLVGKEKPSNLAITKLYPTRAQVDSINQENMLALETETRSFREQWYKDLPLQSAHERSLRKLFTEEDINIELETLSNSILCETNFQIKVGAQVMCIINIKEDGVDLLCNGSQGKVMAFCTITGYPIVKFNNNITKTMTPNIWQSDRIPGIGVSQVPLILAWALTIHKSQGSTLDSAEIDVGSGIFQCGQTYVALSRVKSLEGLFLTSYDYRRIMVFKKVKDYYTRLRAIDTTASAVKDPSIKIIKLK